MLANTIYPYIAQGKSTVQSNGMAVKMITSVLLCTTGINDP